MTEDDARDRLGAEFGGAALEKLDLIARAVIAHSAQQNLISRATLPTLWQRHILDSAQLLRFSSNKGLWLDVGTGAGFPGLVIAVLTEREMTLCEPRRRRAEFLTWIVDDLSLKTRVKVEPRRVEALEDKAETISARAVATVASLLAMAQHLACGTTEWILPRGVSGNDELSSLSNRPRRMFHVERSLTDPHAVVLVGRGTFR